MRLLRLALLLLVNFIFNTQTIWGMATPVIDTISTTFDSNVIKIMPASITEFKRENLGKVMSVIGVLKNKKLERNTPPFTYGGPEPLFENFEGGEWVLVPLKQGRKERLCAGIFASFLHYEVNSCYIITKKMISSEDHTTEFSYLVTPLTNLYLFKKHFTLDKQGDPKKYKSLNHDQPEDSEEDRIFLKKDSYIDDQQEDLEEYKVPLEKSICAEFEEWLEDHPQRDVVRRTTTRQQHKFTLPLTEKLPFSASLLPEITAQNRDKGYETIYEKTNSKEPTPTATSSLSERPTPKESPSSSEKLYESHSRLNESASSPRKISSPKLLIRTGFKSNL